MKSVDILVIGSGLAGIVSALTAADAGKKVLILSKMDSLLSGNTHYAQGGIIFKGVFDSPEKLEADIEKAGDGHCWPPAVKQLCELGPKLVEEILINRCNVDFDHKSNGNLDLTAEGAHSEHRIIHSKDKTGKAIHEAVISEMLKHPNIDYLLDHTVVDLLTLSHHSKNSLDIYEKPACFGAFVLNNLSGEVFPIFANQTILATGGLGQLYKHTSNPIEATGDGLALAWRAGARCFNLEYIQFHPTTFYNEHDRFLISESMRGEGAKLLNKDGKPFMLDFHPQGDLAPRDIVARGIHQQMLDTNHPCVYLDISFKDSSWIKDRFPTIYENCFTRGVDICSEPIPVVPAAHYSCGGVGVSLKGRTSLQRLYAVGEVSCTGVHGANRLASTSLLENVVWGYQAGLDAAEHCSSTPYFPAIYEWKEGEQLIDPTLIAQDWENIRNSMWNYVGLIRTKQRLHRAKTIFRHLQSEIEQFYQQAKMTKAIVQLRNGIQSAIAVTQATMETRESRGAHYLKD
jgi:L-aspartate oxidase